MILPLRDLGRFTSRFFVLGVAVWGAVIGSANPAHGGDCPGNCTHGHPAAGNGVYPGVPGFGLSYHLGYGYGGPGLGTGGEGGYPFYGGPGYPHEAPPLRRCKKILPYVYNGGPGYSIVGEAQPFFQGVGPLVIDRPVAVVDSRENPEYAGDYGQFTGVLPYPGSKFAPYASPSESNRRPGMDIQPSPLLPRQSSPPYSPSDPYSRPTR